MKKGNLKNLSDWKKLRKNETLKRSRKKRLRHSKVKTEKKQIVPSKLLWKWFHLNDNTNLQPRVKKLSYQTSRLLYRKVFGFPIGKNEAFKPSYLYISYL